MTFRLAHVSDLHLTGDEDERDALNGLFTSLSEWEVDHVLVTGDVSRAGEAAAFRILDEARREHGFGPARSTVIPGNHDVPGRRAFSKRFGGGWQVVRKLAGGAVRLIGLDSTGENVGAGALVHHPVGWLEDSQLEGLRRTLGQLRRGNAAVVVGLHHHVVDLPAPGWLQQAGIPAGLWGPLWNSDEFLDIVGQYGVDLVLSGHDHGVYDRTVRRDGARIRCLVGGSTFDVSENEAYGYRFFDFNGNRLSDEGWVDLCDTCWSTGALECDACDDDAEVECGACAASGTLDCPDCEGDGSLECSKCDGTGAFECGHCQGEGCGHCGGDGAHDCVVCEGDGWVYCNSCDDDAQVECDECDGAAYLSCPDCDGEGEVECDDC